MAHDRATIDAFLNRTRAGLAPRIRRDLDAIEELAATEAGTARTRMPAWNQFYYQQRWRARDFSFDDESTRRYFPSDRVMAGMLAVYARVLGLRFERLPLEHAWAPGVELYAVRDAASNTLLARFYLDLIPRPGKYSHSAMFSMRGTYVAGGVRRPPVSVLVSNIEPPQHGQVSHLQFDEVRVLFHEFGHIIHYSLAHAHYRSQTTVERDFVEAPAEMFELWPYEPEVLAMISDDAPASVRANISASRRFAKGLYWGGQLAYSFADQEMHATPGGDPDAILRDSFANVVGYHEDPDEHWAASFEHAIGGYPAAYYAYLWSAAYAADMFTRFASEGIFGAKVGRDYRAIVLERDGREPSTAVVEKFLGRKFDEQALLRSLDP